jgi:hypothetical protein
MAFLLKYRTFGYAKAAWYWNHDPRGVMREDASGWLVRRYARLSSPSWSHAGSPLAERGSPDPGLSHAGLAQSFGRSAHGSHGSAMVAAGRLGIPLEGSR